MMTDKITGDISSVYAKIQQDTALSLKKYQDGIKALEKQRKQSWTFTGLKEALFWCMCLGILVLVGRAAFDAYGIQTPGVIWQILYPCSFLPIILYAVRKIAEKPKG